MKGIWFRTLPLLLTVVLLGTLLSGCTCEGPGDGGETAVTPAAEVTEELEMEGVFAASPSMDMLNASNTLFTPSFSTYTDEGKEIALMHDEIARAVIDKIKELDLQYHSLFQLSSQFDASLDGVFATWHVYFSQSPQAESLREWYEAEEELYNDYLALKTCEMVDRAYIDKLRELLASVEEEEELAPNWSLTQSEYLLLLLGRYAEMSRTYIGKYTVLLPQAMILHTKEQQADSGLPAELLEQLRPRFEREEELITQLLEADRKIQELERQIAYGMEGLKEFHHEVLRLSIAELERQIEQAEAMLEQLQAQPDKLEEAEIAALGLQLYRGILLALENADQALTAAGTPSWLAGRPAGEAPKVAVSPFFFSAKPVYASLGALDRLWSITKKTVATVTKPVVWVGKGARYVVKKTVGHAAHAVSLATKLAADEFYGYYYGLSEEDRRDLTLNTIDEHYREWKSGNAGARALTGVVDAFQAVEEGAKELTEEFLARHITGKGWISWGAGQLATAAVGIFTGLGKGIAQVSNPEASNVEIAEGTANIILSIIGGSSAIAPTGVVGKPVQRLLGSAGKVLKSVKGSALEKISAYLAKKTAVQRLLSQRIKNLSRFLGSGGEGLIEGANKAAQALMSKFRKAIARDFGRETWDTMTQFIKNIPRDVAEAACEAWPKGFKEMGENVVNRLYKDYSGSKGVIKAILEQATPENLITGVIDNNTIIPAVKSLTESLSPAARENPLQLAAEPVSITPQNYVVEAAPAPTVEAQLRVDIFPEEVKPGDMIMVNVVVSPPQVTTVTIDPLEGRFLTDEDGVVAVPLSIDPEIQPGVYWVLVQAPELGTVGTASYTVVAETRMTVTASPERVEPGGEVLVTIQVLPPQETELRISGDIAEAYTTKTGENGIHELTITVDPEASGEYVINVEAPELGLSGSASFSVVAAPTPGETETPSETKMVLDVSLLPPGGLPGDYVIVGLTNGLAQDTEVWISWMGQDYGPYLVRASRAGQLIHSFEIPPGTPLGEYKVTVRAPALDAFGEATLTVGAIPVD